MRWWGRRETIVEQPDSDLPSLGRVAAGRFRAEAMAAFRRQGIETTYAAGTLHAMGSLRFPLHRLASMAAQTPQRRWPQLLDDHARVLVAAERQPTPRQETLAASLHLSLWPLAGLPWAPDHARAVTDDLVALPAIDQPDTVTTAGHADQVLAWGGWPTVERIGLANLAALRSDDVLTLGQQHAGQAVHALIGGYFTASRLLVLDRVLSAELGVERPAHGAVVAVPHRGLLVVHVLRSLDVVGAIPRMLALASAEVRRPEGISPHLYFWRDGRVQRISRLDDDSSPVVEVTGEFADALAEIA